MKAAGEHADEPGLQADQELLNRSWLRVGAGAVVAAQAMVFSFAVNLDEVEEPWIRWVVHGLLIFSAVLPLVWLGGDLVRSALDSVRARRVTIDLLFLVTLLGAFAGSLTATFTGKGSVYYEVVAILIVVHTLGKMLGARSRMAALRAVEGTREAFSKCLWVQDGTGNVQEVEVDRVPAGGRVQVAPGGAVCVDGVVREGRAYVNEASITGEWKPVVKIPGDAVWAGSFSVDGDLVVERVGAARRLDQVLEAVEKARLAPSAVQAEADRLMTWFLPLVTGTSAVTFLFWCRLVPWQEALFHSMAVLLVACPCAMGLATPVAVWGGLAALSRKGLVARTGDFLASLATVDHVCFDKTGTLSEDRLEVEGWSLAGGGGEWRTWVASLEEGVAHPVARAIAAAVKERVPVSERRLHPGLGVEGRVGNHVVKVGEAGFASAPASEVDSGKCVHVSVDGVWAGRVVLSESWRAGFSTVADDLSRVGVTSEVLSGDPAAPASLPGMSSVRGGLGPAEKAARVEACRKAGKRVLFVGDGANDAAAMATADVAIAMRGGAGIALGASGAVFAGENLVFLPEAIELSRRTLRAVKLNLLFAAAYNVAGMILAAGGRLHPVAAALLMLGSSLWVSVWALRATSEPR